MGHCWSLEAIADLVKLLSVLDKKSIFSCNFWPNSLCFISTVDLSNIRTGWAVSHIFGTDFFRTFENWRDMQVFEAKLYFTFKRPRPRINLLEWQRLFVGKRPKRPQHTVAVRRWNLSHFLLRRSTRRDLKKGPKQLHLWTLLRVRNF